MALVNIVTKRSPEDLPQEDLRVLWKDTTTTELSPSFTYFLETLIEPRTEDRFEDAEKAPGILESHYAPESITDLIEKPLSNYVQEIQKKEIEKGIDEWRAKIVSVAGLVRDLIVKVDRVELILVVAVLFVIVLSLAFNNAILVFALMVFVFYLARRFS